MSDVKSLLPENASQGLKDYEQVTAYDIKVNIQDLWNPMKCPEHLLGFLAWALSVDQWDERWPVEMKREVVAVSPAVHRIKGTRKSVEDALSTIGFNTEIRPWFETGGHPYTFQIDAWGEDVFASGGGINTRTYNMVKHAIEYVKSARDHFDFRIGERFESETQMRVGSRPQYLDQLDHDPMPPNETPQVEFANMTTARMIARSQITHTIEGRAA